MLTSFNGVRRIFILLLLINQSLSVFKRKCMVFDDKTDHPERPRRPSQSQTSEHHVFRRGLEPISMPCDEQYVVPVVWHVIVSKNGVGNVSDATIREAMTVLDDDFTGSRLHFHLHSIQRVINDGWNKACVREKSSYMEQLATTPDKVINVYTCTFNQSQDSIVGDAALPWSHEQDSVYNGVVIHPGTLPGGNFAPLNRGKNLVHEVGHYFGLLHYFETGKCDGDGDMVDDTPASSMITYMCPGDISVDSCPDDPGNDPIHNFMGYAEDACLFNFTKGQLSRMSWILDTYKYKLKSIVYRPCSIDTVFRWSNGWIYFFSGSNYYRYNEATQSIDSGYPKAIGDDWQGVPSNIDGVFRYSNGFTYFFKGSNYYRYNDSSLKVDLGYPKTIKSFWKGIPNHIDDVIKYSNGHTYFFKNDTYYRFNSETQTVDAQYPIPMESYWTGIPGTIDGAFTWYNGEVYFFKDNNFWMFNVRHNEKNMEKQSYPKSIKIWWSDAQQFTGYSVFSECQGGTYFVSGDRYWAFSNVRGTVHYFYPQQTWRGMPNMIDAMFIWKDNHLYVFSGQDYYIFDTETKALVQGYPQKLSLYWKGVPNNIDAVFRSSNGYTYFFKGSHYFRFNDARLQVDIGYPKLIKAYWKGVPDDLDSVDQTSHSHAYFFKGNNYYRFNFEKGAVDDGYPRRVVEDWKGMLYNP